LLADLREEESKEEEVVTKSMPIPEGESMQETQFKATLLYGTCLARRTPHAVFCRRRQQPRSQAGQSGTGDGTWNCCCYWIDRHVVEINAA
jgi:hypothetical protein